MTLTAPPPTHPSPASPEALIPEARRRGRRRIARWSVLALAVVLVAGAATITALAASGTSGRHGLGGTGAVTASAPRVATCTGDAVVEPTTLTLTCADANSALTATRWSAWGATSARGVTTFALNLCTPNCAASPLSYFPGASVVLDAPVATGHGDRFSRAVVTYRWGGVTHRVVQPLTTGGRP
ncbi:MAG: hypothetical protein B7Z69_05075 [Actinobacteria bacterium 21-73-9]|nr:MAG: hypothetical protein B7Z69_05075 [Actinobacteria bacterium 21-73-9]